MYARLPVENADTVSLVCALLGRFPEVSSLRTVPSDGTVRLTFAVKGRLDRSAQAGLADGVIDHVHGLLLLEKDAPDVLQVECESDRKVTFVHVTRDLETFSKSELEMLVGFFGERFGDALVRTHVAGADAAEDPTISDEAALYAIEAMRDPGQSKSLVGFREEQRVLVYFLKTRKKPKAARR